MATQGRTEGGVDDTGRALAATLREATFLHVVAHADGDALAAAGLLAAAADADGTPYQVSTAATASDAARRARETDAEATCLVVGLDGDAADATLAGSRPVSRAAASVVETLGYDPDPTLALAGVCAAGATPGDGTGRLLDAAHEAGVETRPGVGVPTENLADGLAHSTLVHVDCSGDREAAGALLAELDLPVELDDAAHRRVASLVAVDVATRGPNARPALERALRPLVPGGPFATVQGYGDVLDAVARAEPGLAAALALSHDVRPAALDAWRDHARAAHAAVESADPVRHRGAVVVRGDPVWTVARLVRDFRSPEPATLALADGRAALATRDDRAGSVLASAATTVGGSAGAAGSLAEARFDPDDEAAFVDAVREAL